MKLVGPNSLGMLNTRIGLYATFSSYFDPLWPRIGPVGIVSQSGAFGTYFVGYARSPRRMEQMIENMFIGKPPGNYDRLLDFSRAVTGTLFFVPTATFLEDVAPGAAAPSTAGSTPTEGESAAPAEPPPSEPDGSLGIGSLKREAEEE